MLWTRINVSRQRKLFSNQTVTRCKNLLDHLTNNIFPWKEDWSQVTGFKNIYSTNNAEISFVITKENQYDRVKEYSFAELLDIVSDNSVHYVHGCIDIGNNRTSQFQNQKSRYLPKKCSIDVSKISVIENNMPNSLFQVNMMITNSTK